MYMQAQGMAKNDKNFQGQIDVAIAIWKQNSNPVKSLVCMIYMQNFFYKHFVF